MRTLTLPSGEAIPVLGQGTWRMGERPARLQQEVRALQTGLDLGITLMDTAEMYGEGGAEEVVAEAIRGRRDDIFIVSKVYPHNATTAGTIEACERSLSRLETDRIDLYLLHWRGGADITQTLEAFDRLMDAGKIRHFGVSNFDTNDMTEWHALPGGNAVATNQILYNLNRRWSEWSLLPWCREHHIPVMAYTPLEPATGRVKKALDAVARRHNCSPAQIALAWVLRQPGVVTIPKASNPEHVKDNVNALDISLTDDDIAELDKAYPAPSGPAGLELN